MRLFKNFKYKLLISVLVGCLSSLYQMETKDELVVCEKKVMLSKPRLDVYEFLSNLENYPAWYPNMISAKAMESQKQIGVGQRYQFVNTYLFGIGETTTQATILGVQKPVMFEYINENFLMERNRLEFNLSEKNRTVVNWSVFSRRKSLLFKITAGPLYQFYYSQILREGLFSLQFRMKK